MIFSFCHFEGLKTVTLAEANIGTCEKDLNLPMAPFGSSH